jgi:hypothetical protein
LGPPSDLVTDILPSMKGLPCSETALQHAARFRLRKRYLHIEVLNSLSGVLSGCSRSCHMLSEMPFRSRSSRRNSFPWSKFLLIRSSTRADHLLHTHDDLSIKRPEIFYWRVVVNKLSKGGRSKQVIIPTYSMTTTATRLGGYREIQFRTSDRGDEWHWRST